MPEEPDFQVGQIDRQAPWPPAQELFLNASVTDFTRQPDGSMLLSFTPVKGTDTVRRGWDFDTPTVTVFFDPDSWELFKGRVSRDGTKGITPVKPKIFSPNGPERMQ